MNLNFEELVKKIGENQLDLEYFTNDMNDILQNVDDDILQEADDFIKSLNPK